MDHSLVPRTGDRGPHPLLRPAENISEILVANLANRTPRRDARLPERFGEPHVPDARDEALVEERFADRTRAVTRSNATDEIGDLGLGREQIRPETSKRPPVEREHRPVPLPRLPRAAPKHEPWQAAQRRATLLEPPAAVHPQVAPERHPAGEPEQEVLPDRVDTFEHAPVDDVSDPGRPSPRMRALRLDALADERLQERRDASDRVAFRHRSPRVPLPGT